jgi:hypothetical protein
MARASRSQANPQAYPNGRPIANAGRRSGGNKGGSNKLFAPGGVKLGNTTNTGITAKSGSQGGNGPKPGAGAPGKVVSGTKRMRGGRSR